jgi:hypothetical protein
MPSCAPPQARLVQQVRAPIVRPGFVRSNVVCTKQFSVAALDFGYTGAEGWVEDLRRSIPAMLLTELFGEGRLAVYDGGSIRLPVSDELIKEATASQFVDGYVSGTITSHVLANGTGKVCFDIRLSNAKNHQVLFAQPACVSVRRESDTLALERNDIRGVATAMSAAVKQVPAGSIISAEGDLVTINRGTSAGVTRGMMAYLTADGDGRPNKIVDGVVGRLVPSALARTGGMSAVVGEMYVTSVEADRSLAVLFRGDYAVPGDAVYFK